MGFLTHIYVEGDGDVKFISDYISHIKPDTKTDIVKEKNRITAKVWFNNTLIATIHGLSGWTDIENMKTVITKYKEMGNDVLAIFDADTNDNEGGFAKRKKQIENFAFLLDDIFLFPNNQDDGSLEDLLENIINKTNKPIFDCWDEYETCLQKCASERIGKKLTTPAKKSKIYGYLEALLGESNREKEKIKDPNRDYKNSVHWNLDADYLIPLKNFLEKFIIKS